MQVDVFAHKIEAMRDRLRRCGERNCLASLHQNINQYPLSQQKWLEEICQELYAILEELPVTQEALRQQNEELEIKVQQRTAELRNANLQLQSEIAERKRTEEELEKSLSLLRGTLEATVDGILVSQNTRNIATFNQNFVEMWGIPEAVIASRDLNQVLPLILEQLKDSEAFLCQTKDLLSQPNIDGYGILELKDGRIFERYSQPQWMGGNIVGRVCSFRDITEYKRREAALRESEERYRRIIETTSEGVWIIDAESKTVFANNRIAEMLGYTLDEILGRPILAFMSEEWQAITIAMLIHIQRRPQGSKETFDLKFRRKDGSSLWAIVSANPIFDQAGQYAGALGMFADITERKQAEEEIQQSEQKYRNLFHNSLVGMFRTTLTDGTVLDANTAALKMFGLDSYEGVKTADLYVNPADRETLKQLLLETGFVENFEAQLQRKDGSGFWISFSAKLYAKDGYLEGVMIDITQRKQSEEALRAKKAFLKIVLGNIPQFIFWKDRNSVYLGCNRNFAIAAGLNSPEDIIGKTDYDLPWKKEESDWFHECDARVMETDTPEYHIIEPQLQADGKQAWLDTSKIPLHDAEGNVVGLLGSYEDITERKVAQEKIHYQAMHDLLTGLPNRTLFNEQLSVSLTKAANSKSMLAVMFLDLDRFKTINDTLGHAVGDRLLQKVAQRLSSCLGEDDTVARWGGDEFTLLVSQTTSAEAVAKIAQRILDALKPAFNLEEHSHAWRSTSLHISSSIGIALYPQNGEDAETLLRNADAALYRAKQQGRNNYQFYSAAMNSQASQLLLLENQLHHALSRGELVVYYQPQVNTITGAITGMEALVRWQHPQFGLVTPAKFIPLAEETGLIVPIGEWVLQTACAQNKAWQEAGLPPIRVAVNLSARQFQQPFLLNIVAQTLEETGLSPQCLELEITEGIAMQDVELTKAILSNLHQMGVHLSMDDFGTGYCSLSYLKQFPLHTLKIDKSFVQDIATDSQNAAIIEAIMTLGRGFNLRVIAEGVETEAQKDCLLRFDCQEMQGYLSSPPLPPQEATLFLRNYHAMRGNISVIA